jgi:hypothetical protein
VAFGLYHSPTSPFESTLEGSLRTGSQVLSSPRSKVPRRSTSVSHNPISPKNGRWTRDFRLFWDDRFGNRMKRQLHIRPQLIATAHHLPFLAHRNSLAVLQREHQQHRNFTSNQPSVSLVVLFACTLTSTFPEIISYGSSPPLFSRNIAPHLPVPLPYIYVHPPALPTQDANPPRHPLRHPSHPPQELRSGSRS